MPADDLAAVLAEIREELDSSALVLRHGTDPGARLLAAAGAVPVARIALGAVDAVLKLAAEAEPVDRDYGGEPIWWNLTPEEIRSAVLAALTGKGNG